MFKNWRDAYLAQQVMSLSEYDNRIDNSIVNTGVFEIDRMPYAIKGSKVVWLIMAPNAYLDDYEESATEYGITEDGKWAAVSDGHCSCYGWEAKPENITFYDNLKQLLACDEQAKIIVKSK